MELGGGRRNQMELGGGRRNQMELEGGGSGGPGLPSDRALQPAGNRNYSICNHLCFTRERVLEKIKQAFTNVGRLPQLGSAYLAYFLPNFSASLDFLKFHSHLFLISSSLQ
jgi:hypothetical protein